MEPLVSRILMIDDDAELCALMSEYLGKEGFEISAVHDGAAGLRAALGGGYGLVILDVMLPIVDGFVVLRQIRRQSTMPVIMLTARADEHDRIEGLGDGADDYLVKPFAAAELLARIRAVHRRVFRTVVPAPKRVQVGQLRLGVQQQRAWHGAASIELTSTECVILETLMRAAGRIVSRDELSAVLYQRQATPFERSLDVHVSHLRRKLEAAGWMGIRTVRGLGYLCAAEG